MRSMPEEHIIDIIVDMVYNSISFPYLNFINKFKCKDRIILISPDYNDKIILLKSIIKYYSDHTDKYDFLIDNHIQELVESYNKINMITIKNNDIPFNDILLYKADDKNLWTFYNINFISEKHIIKIEENYKSKEPLPVDILDQIKIQMFIFASLFIDMNELLIYLFKKYLIEE